MKYLNGMILSLDAIYGEINEDHGAHKTAEFFLCPIIGDIDVDLPLKVGVSAREFEGDVNEFVNFIDIFYEMYYEEKSERNIAVCPGPVYNNYDNALRIAEYIEMYKILGATKFYIYKSSIGEKAFELLKFYESQGTVEFLDWNLGDFVDLSEEIIHSRGIIAALNDCFYRATNVDTFKYFIHSDFDEIIFPYEVDTLKEFLKENDKSQYHSFNFNNYFFFSSFQYDFSNVSPEFVNKFLYTQAKIKRLHAADELHTRSKYIAKGDSVFEVGYYFVWLADQNTKEFEVNTSLGALHHYRDECAFENFDYCDRPTETEDHARKFGELLWKNVDEVCQKVFEDGICPTGTNEITAEIMIQE